MAGNRDLLYIADPSILKGVCREKIAHETASSYTLQPILRDGQGCLAWGDVPGIEAAALTELEVRYRTRPVFTETYRSSDVLGGLLRLQRRLDPSADLTRAGFVVRLRDGRLYRVVVQPPSQMTVDPTCGSDVITDWLTRRGFLCDRAGTLDIDIGSVVGTA